MWPRCFSSFFFACTSKAPPSNTHSRQYMRGGCGVCPGYPVGSTATPQAEGCEHYFFNPPTPPPGPASRRMFFLLKFIVKHVCIFNFDPLIQSTASAAEKQILFSTPHPPQGSPQAAENHFFKGGSFFKIPSAQPSRRRRKGWSCSTPPLLFSIVFVFKRFFLIRFDRFDFFLI